MGNADLRQRLRRLGLHQGVRHLKPQPRRQGPGIEELLAGEVVELEQGSFFQYREVHPLDYHHGHHTLAELLSHTPQGPALLARDERLAGVEFQRMAFVDTETTGLAGGSGTYAFLVGVGLFEGESFTIHQFFMRDYGEEPALLHALGGMLDELEAIVSFNGKSFDMPLLETRFIMARQQPRLVDAPHLDLLPVARRFWKYRLDSCALSSLETSVLGVRRTQEDVPGWFIPRLYADYARTRDAREMPRIFYHNAQDILSLVTLTARLCTLLAGPLLAGPFPPDGDIPGEDLYGLGRFLYDLGDMAGAEAAYREAARTCQASGVREMAMRDLAYLLKRQERRDEMVSWWQQLADIAGAVYACEELAKHYEWHEEDLAQARVWTERGVALAEAWPPGPKRKEALSDLKHRLERLTLKLSSQ